MAKVSIIMPSLNVAGYIGETMDSVLAQTLKEIEVICVDAGSTDGTLEILRGYASKDHRVHLIESEKKSYGYQMNLGIDAAAGEYIGIVETDDYIEPDMYETMYDAALAKNVDIVKGDFDMFTMNSNGQRVFVEYSLGRQNRVGYDTIYSCDEYLSGKSKPECYIWNAIYRKGFLQENNVKFNETPGASFQDFSFRYQTAFFAKRIYALKRVFYHYRRDNTSASTYNVRTAEYNFRETKYTLEIIQRIVSKDRRIIEAFAKEAVEYAIWPYVEILKHAEPSETSEEAFRGYKEMFMDFVSKGYITDENIENRLWLMVNLLFESVEAFSVYAKVFARLENNKVLKYIGRIEREEPIIVFGAGVRGRAVYSFFTNNGYNNIKAFCDNGRGSIGEKVFGLDILNPQEATSRYPGALFIISSPAYETEIRNQLSEYGIQDDRVSLYPLMVDPLFCTNCLVEKNS